MKRQNICFLLLLFFCTPILAKMAVQKDEIINQQPVSNQLLETISIDLADPNYRQHILPNNFSYLMQLLEYGSKTGQSREYAQNVISLFSKLLKGSEYANSYKFSELLNQFPDHLKHYFSGYKLESQSQLILANDLDMLERLEQTVTSIVYNKFAKDFASCKSNPEQFLKDLSHRIVQATSQEVNMEQLRQMVIRFLEVGLSKLVWSPRDEEKSWESVKAISHQLAKLMEYNIIDDINDIDELFWTLVHRYRYFLELHSTDMPLTFYHQIRKDIQNQKLILFELEEQESFLQTKASCLLGTVIAQEAKKRAFDYQQQPISKS